MSFVAKLQRAREVLEQQGRLSVRALGRELDIAGDELEELIEELVEIQQVARQEGRALVWSGGAAQEPAPAPHPTAPAPGRSPLDYTPSHLADKILTTKSAIEGERKQVTVLFVDLQRSMELSEGIDPEDWHEIMGRFFAILADGVHRFEGTVNQYTNRPRLPVASPTVVRQATR